jgi:hypothetical protein
MDRRESPDANERASVSNLCMSIEGYLSCRSLVDQHQGGGAVVPARAQELCHRGVWTGVTGVVHHGTEMQRSFFGDFEGSSGLLVDREVASSGVSQSVPQPQRQANGLSQKRSFLRRSGAVPIYLDLPWIWCFTTCLEIIVSHLAS